jgi:hypothetical protein
LGNERLTERIAFDDSGDGGDVFFSRQRGELTDGRALEV